MKNWFKAGVCRAVANDSLSTLGNRDVLDGDFLIGPRRDID